MTKEEIKQWLSSQRTATSPDDICKCGHFRKDHFHDERAGMTYCTKCNQESQRCWGYTQAKYSNNDYVNAILKLLK